MTDRERFHEIERLYHLALEREPSQRAGFLKSVCGNDEGLRNEVESLLAREGEAASFMEKPALEVAAQGIAQSEALSFVGRRVGSYDILGLLGAGGMGEVYRARDTKLGRDVALKVLPESFAHDTERRTRFEREARFLASLNHPNIATIYGLQESDGVCALVMELVEGPTLAERIGGRAMPLDEAQPIAKQISEGLEYAHERGIIHRDLKPANVKLTADGNVKILDFGLAKALETPTPQGNPSISPTLTLEGTRAGVILGTAAYMAPEQARGAIVDKRADIWAFGVVLYEMLTGKRPFAGETVSDTLAAVLKAEPDWELVPVAARQLIRRCLTKDPKIRLRDIGDVRILTAEVDSAEDTPTKTAPQATLWKIAAGILAVTTFSAIALLWRSSRPASQPQVRFTEVLPEFASPASIQFGNILLSPDGTRLVYTRRESEGKFRLYTRTLDQEAAVAIPGTEDASFPFFSPDGQSLGFFANGKLKRTAVQGGGTVELCEAPYATGGSWGEDDNIVAGLFPFSGLSRVSASGGPAQPLTQLKNENSHRWPEVLPGAQAVLFTADARQNSGFEEASIEVQDLRTMARRTLIRAGYYGRYVASGHLLYMHQGTLYAAPMDLNSLQLKGPSVPVVEAVTANADTGFAAFYVSRNGTLAYVKGKTTQSAQRVVWLESGGRTVVARPVLARYEKIRVSPDGKRLAMTIWSGNSSLSSLWVYDLERDVSTQLTRSAGGDEMPVWAPDGKHIVFASDRHGGPSSLYWIRSDGAGEPIRLSKDIQVPTSFSPDGKWLAVMVDSPGKAGLKADIWVVPFEDVSSDHPKVGKAEPFFPTPFESGFGAISPDGQWMAYHSDESGQFELYVRPFKRPGGKWQISAGGLLPIWSRKGQELFYMTGESIMAVSYSLKGEEFVAGKPRLWAAKKGISFLDAAPDGKRFAVVLNDEPKQTERTGPPGPSQVTFLLNFFDELRRRAPANK